MHKHSIYNSMFHTAFQPGCKTWALHAQLGSCSLITITLGKKVKPPQNQKTVTKLSTVNSSELIRESD